MAKLSLEKIIVLSLVAYLIGFGAVQYFLADIDLSQMTQQESETLWLLQLVRDIGFWGFCFFVVVSPLFRYLAKREKKHLYYVVLAVCGNIGFIGVMLHSANLFSELPHLTGKISKSEPELLAQYQKFINSDLENPQEHSKVTKIMATTFYEDSGLIVKVIEENGKLVDFEPTPENVKKRREFVQTDALMQHQAKALKGAAITQAFLLIMAIVCGLISHWLANKYRQTRISKMP